MATPSKKHEWRKAEKALYLPKTRPEFIDVPPQRFLTIEGEGNPNTEHFAQHIQALYPVAYGIKMTAKKLSNPPEGYHDYTVYPLEGIWDINDEAKATFDGTLNKDDLVYKLMIRQPDFIDHDYFDEIVAQIRKRKPYPLLDQVKFEEITDGHCIQMLHIGPFDDEPASFQEMETFAAQAGHERLSKIHREIYLSDFRKTPPEKLKTVLRFGVK